MAPITPMRAAFLFVFAIASGALAAPAPHHLRSTPDNVVWGYFSADTPPVLRIKSGDTVVIDTISLDGVRDDEPEKFYIENHIPMDWPVVQDTLAIKKRLKRPGLGPHMLTGPIFIEGAMPGDTLEVRIVDITSRAPYGVNSGRPGSGGIADVVPRPYGKVVWFDLERQVAKFSDAIEVPLAPFQGVMAVAPSLGRGRLSSTPPYPDIGGNFDNRRLGKGATLYFPIQVEGALFHTGDPHAAQGNGEVSGTALESSNTVTMQFIVRHDLKISSPRAETPTHYLLMGLDPQLEVAMRKAIQEALGFLRERKQLDAFDALALTSMGVDFEVTQIVDRTQGVHAMIPKALFKDDAAYWFRDEVPKAKR